MERTDYSDKTDDNRDQFLCRAYVAGVSGSTVTFKYDENDNGDSFDINQKSSGNAVLFNVANKKAANSYFRYNGLQQPFSACTLNGNFETAPDFYGSYLALLYPTLNNKNSKLKLLSAVQNLSQKGNEAFFYINQPSGSDQYYRIKLQYTDQSRTESVVLIVYIAKKPDKTSVTYKPDDDFYKELGTGKLYKDVINTDEHISFKAWVEEHRLPDGSVIYPDESLKAFILNSQ